MLRVLKKLLDDEKTVLFIAIGVSVIFLTLFVVIAALARTIADDFEYFSKPNISNPILFVNDFWHHSGRLTQGFIVSGAYSIFGELSVKVMPLLLISGLSAASSFAAYLLLSRKTNYRVAKAIVVGTLFALSIVLFVPSPFDSFFWLTSSTIYASSLIYLMLFAAVCMLIWRIPKGLTNKQYVVIGSSLFLGVFILQMISEPASILVGLIAGLLLVYSFIRQKRHQLYYYGTALVASILGFFMIYFSAGSTGRRAKNTLSFEFDAILRGVVQDFITLADMIVSWKLLLVVFLSAVVIAIFGTIAKRYTLHLVLLGASLIVIPPLLIFTMTNYSIGYTAMRAFSVPSLAILTGMTLVITAIFSNLPKLNRAMTLRTARAAVILLAPLVVLLALPEPIKIIRAESLRGSMLTFRSDYINQQKTEGASVIILPPAPLLLDTTEAIDVGFNHEPGHRGTWLVKGLKHYYGLTGMDVDVNSTAQPYGYCMPYTPYNRFNERTAQSCYDLSRQHFTTPTMTLP